MDRNRSDPTKQDAKRMEVIMEKAKRKAVGNPFTINIRIYLEQCFGQFTPYLLTNCRKGGENKTETHRDLSVRDKNRKWIHWLPS
jgi:hypothetical protein